MALDTFSYSPKNESLVGVTEKSSSLSFKYREEGNKLYSSKEHSEEVHRLTLILYNKCIAFASGSEELALGYSNQSALLKHLKKYEESIVDTDRALEISKSQRLLEKLKARREDCLIKLTSNLNDQPQELDIPSCFVNLKQYISKLNKNRHIFNLPPLDSIILPDPCKIENLEPRMIPSNDIPYAADCVELKYNKVYGRHLVAARDIKAGEILVVQKGFVMYSRKDLIYANCAHCLNFAWNALPCDGCACVIYCSEPCKEEALQEYHDIECKILPYLQTREGDNLLQYDIMCTLKLFLKFVKSEGLEAVKKDAENIDDNKYVCKNQCHRTKSLCYGKFHSIYSMAYNMEKLEKADNINELIFSKLIDLLLKKTNILDSLKNLDSEDVLKTKEFLRDLLMKLKNILATNSYRFQLDASSDCDCRGSAGCNKCNNFILGSIFAPTACFMNHSCVPNVGRIFIKGGRIVLFSCLPIKKGEQLLVSYGPGRLMSKEERIKYLKENYNFSCQCEACAKNWPIIDLNDTFQILLYTNPESEKIRKLLNFCSEKNISLLSLFVNLEQSEYLSEKTLEDNVKVVEMAYANYDPATADSLIARCKDLIQMTFQKFYGSSIKIPNRC